MSASSSVNNNIYDSYVFQRTPEKYGNNQPYFIAEKSRIVGEMIDKLRTAVSNKDDLEALFHTFLEYCGAERCKIAVATKSENAEHFGMLRNTHSGLNLGHTGTGFAAEYVEYGHRILCDLQKIFKANIALIRESTHKTGNWKTVLSGKKSLGRSNRFEIEVFSPSAVIERKLLTPPSQEEYLQFIKTHCGKKVVNGMTVLDLRPNEHIQQRLKACDLTLYERDKRSSLIPNEYYGDGWPRHYHLVEAKSRLEIDGKAYAMSTYIAYFCIQNVDNMLDYSRLQIYHHDPFLMKDSLKDLAKVFANIVGIDSSREITLKENMGLFRKMFADIMPFARGSAAIAEWFEEMLFDFHGYRVILEGSKSWDLEGFAQPLLSDFVTKYVAEINVVKK